ncbi:MAG: LytR/AlgR family response regulator transcription factor [Clostridium sp.]
MNCIIVDDELTSREELKYFIKNFSSIQIQKEFNNGACALKYLQNKETDIVFLDINIPILDGIELSKILYKNNKNIRFVFITAYKDYAFDAFEVHAFDYILKPYSKERIISSLERLEEIKKEYVSDDKFNNINKNKENNISTNKISVIKEEKIYVIDVDDIYYIEAQGHGIKVYTKNTEYFSKNKISEIQNRLYKNEFYKVHRSYIVNLRKIEEIEPWFNGTYILKMHGIETKIPVSRTNVKEFKKIMGIK